MKVFSSIQAIGFLFLSLLFVTSCKEKVQPRLSDNTTLYNEFVRGYTSGLITSKQGVEVHFVDFNQLNKLDPGTLISFDPAIEGQASWKNARTLIFHPSDRWPAGTSFNASVHLNGIPELKDKKEDFHFSFDIQKKTFNLISVRLDNSNSSDLNSHQLSGILHFSEEIPINKVEKMLRVSNKDNEYNITWQHHMGVNRHQFVVKNIQRQDQEFDVVVMANGSPSGIDDTQKYTVIIPPKGTFQYMTHRVNNGSEQSIEIDFSDPINPDQELEGIISFKKNFDARFVVKGNQLKIFPATRQVGSFNLILYDHLKNIKKQKLHKTSTFSIKFFDEKPQVALLKDGVIVPRSEGLKFPFKAVNVRGVRLKIIHILEDNIAFFLQQNKLDGTNELKRAARLIYNDIIHLKTEKAVDLKSWNDYSFNLEQYIDIEPGAVYRVILSLDQAYSLYPCANNQNAQNKQVNWNAETNESDVNYYDNYGLYNYYYGDDYRRNLGNPCYPSYYSQNASAVSQSIISSNHGIIAKMGENNTLSVVISDIVSSAAKSGVKVNIYTYQHTLIGSGTTDNEGLARIEVQGKPYLLVAEQGPDFGYLRLDDGTAESVSMFQVEGQKNVESTKGFIYGERGVWRPGDSIYLQFILQDQNKKLPSDHPIEMKWYNPKAQLVHTQVKTIDNNSIHDFRLKTNNQSPTGVWRAEIKVGNNYFSKNIRIETVKPNRLKMDIDFGQEIIPIKDGKITGTFNSKWLHGANASDLEADIKLKLGSGKTRFEGYAGYRFDDATKEFQQSEKEIFKGKLNNEGLAQISTTVNAKNAPGMLSAEFTSRVFEHGGEFSIDRKPVKISPYNAYVGVKIPKGKGWRGSLKPEDNKIARLAMLDANGKPLSGKVEITIYGLSWRWWYDQNNGRSLSNFMRSKEREPLKSKVVEIKNGEAFYDLPDLGYYGSYLLVVHDGKGGHSASHQFRYYWDRSDANDKESSKMLQFDVVKDKFQVDESIEISIPSNEEGHFIVSLESANDVVKLKRVKAEKNNTKVSFYADPSLVPNAYIYVAYIQPHAQTANDLPIRMYGVQPVFIEDQSTHLIPTLDMADKWEPEQEVEITVGEQNSKEMEYTLAIVDEGLLQLTRFKTPDPWTAFHQKEALSVRTWDLYDEVIGAHAGEMAGLLAIGGDGNVIEVGGVKANRFPPMVKFLGPFKLKKGDRKTHKIKLPNYVGQVRAMVVAATDRAYGNAEKSVEVKKPLMVLASLPRVVGPGETINIPATVFAMEDNIKNVEVSIASGKLFNISEKSKNITFTQIGDEVVYFPVNVLNRIGQEKIIITATGHGQRAVHEINIDVRPSNPPVHKTESLVVEAGETKTINVKLPGLEGTNTLALEVANGINIDLGEKGRNLFRYPHGCIEQTTSRAFPQLYMPKVMELSAGKKATIDINIKGGIDRLYSFQLRNGGLGYWPNATKASPWGTTYAGHFMLEAKSMGYVLPPGYLKNWISYQKSVANNWLPGNYGVRDHGYRWSHELIQAYRLYTLALADAPLIGAMNRLRNQANLSQQATWRLALAYAVIGRKEVATELIASLDTEVKPYKNYGNTFGSRQRDQAMILETLVELGDFELAYKLASKIATEWQKNKWYSTQTTAYTLMGLFKFLNSQPPSDLTFDYTLNNLSKTSINQKNNIFYNELATPDGVNHQVKFTNSGDKRIFVKINTSGVPLEGKEESDAKNLVMKITYTNLAGEQIDPKKIKRGTDFIAAVTIKNPGILGNYKEMALTQIFPSGWEIHNARLDNLAKEEKVDIPEYQDLRDDRVYTYFSVPADQSRTYRTQLTATFPGKFYQPSVFCEAMYDNEIYALEAGKWVEVIEN